MKIISSAKNTQLHQFPNLETKYIYAHVANVTEDFQFFPDTNLFLSINNKSGFEFLRPYTKNGEEIVQRLKKRQVDGLSCGAPSRIARGEVALGFTNGYIKFFNIESADFAPIKFKPDKLGNSVIYLGYNCCDEMLASIYDDGSINIFGLNTGVKMDTMKLDQMSTLLRFHPEKRFHLGVVSWNGAVTVLNTHSKRIIYQDKSAHKAPCPDLCWSPALPDTLVTVGYDCKLNIFDLRRKSVVINVKHQEPYSTVDLSVCGGYCCAGNIKGDVISYDFRYMKLPLNTKRAHDGNVKRVAFVTNSTTDIVLGSIATDQHSIVLQDKSLSSFEQHNLFNEIFDKCSIGHTPQKDSLHKINNFLDFDFQPTKYVDSLLDSSCNSHSEIDPKKSLNNSSSEQHLNRNSMHKPRSSINSNKSVIDEKENHVFSSNKVTYDLPTLSTDQVKNRKSSSTELDDISKYCHQVDLNKIDEIDHSNSKNLQEIITDNVIVTKNDEHSIVYMSEVADKEHQFINVKQSSKPNQLTSEFDKYSNSKINANQQHCDCTKRIDVLENSMNESFDKIELAVKKNQDKIMNQINHVSFGLHSTVWNMEETSIADIREIVLALTHNNSFTQSYILARAENLELKRLLNEFTKKKN